MRLVTEGQVLMTAEDIVAHVPELRRYAWQLTRDNIHADDLLQETLTRALGKLDLYDPSGSFKGWLCTIMKNLFLDDRRRRQKWPSDWASRSAPFGRGCSGPARR